MLMLLTVFTCFSQGKKYSKSIPQSIYSFDETINLNSNYSINEKLNLKSYSFVKIDINDIEDGYFTISFQDTDKVPSKLIYDSYIDIYNDLNLKKSFFKIADLYKPHSNK
jgi:hypothetical protein